MQNSTGHRLTASDFANVQVWISRAVTLADSPELPPAYSEMIRNGVGPDEGQFAG